VLFILPSPISELQHTPLPPQCCKLRSVSSTPCSFVVFTSDSHLNLSKSLGVRQLSSTPLILTPFKHEGLLFLAFVVPMNDKIQRWFIIVVVFTSSSFSCSCSSQTQRRWHRVVVFVFILLLGKWWRQFVVVTFFFFVGVLTKKVTTTSCYLLFFLSFMWVFCCEEGDTIWNMSWVHKHVTWPSTMWSIPCSIMNDIFLSNVYACENEHNLVFTHVPSQCPFICATRYFGEWHFHFINDVGKTLISYAPSSITFKVWLVHMGEWNKR